MVPCGLAGHRHCTVSVSRHTPHLRVVIFFFSIEFFYRMFLDYYYYYYYYYLFIFLQFIHIYIFFFIFLSIFVLECFIMPNRIFILFFNFFFL